MKAGSAVLCFLLLIFFSCTNRDQVPGGIIVPDSMKVIMHDLIIADQFVSQYLLKDSLTRDVKKESQEWYEKLFAVHGTTREAFRKSLTYYSTRPDLEKIIFDSLADNATKERTAFNKLKYGARDSLAKRTADSLAKLRAGPPPLNPDSLKRVILLAHPGLPIPVLLDSVHLRMKKRAAEDSVRRAVQIRDSTRTHLADSLRLKKVSDSLRRKRQPLPGPAGHPVPGRPFLPRPATPRPVIAK